MVTEAEIQQVDQLSGECRVRIPIFETTNSGAAYATAAVALAPGISGGYQAGDLVWIGFELNMADRPVILGKIRQGDSRPSIRADGLQVSRGTVELPESARFSGAQAGYDSPGAIADRVESLESAVKALTQELDELKATLARLESFGAAQVPDISV